MSIHRLLYLPTFRFMLGFCMQFTLFEFLLCSYLDQQQKCSNHIAWREYVRVNMAISFWSWNVDFDSSAVQCTHKKNGQVVNKCWSLFSFFSVFLKIKISVHLCCSWWITGHWLFMCRSHCTSIVWLSNPPLEESQTHCTGDIVLYIYYVFRKKCVECLRRRMCVEAAC